VRGIFFRHVLRDIALATGGVVAVLLVLVITNQLAFMLGRAAEGQIPASVVFEMVALSLRENSAIILPIAVVLGGILGLGRLYHDSELAAAQACGVGPRTLYAAAGVVTVAAAALAAWIAFLDGPRAAIRSTQIRVEALRTASTRGLTPGQFRSLGSGTTLYFRDRNADGSLHEVFVQRRVAARPLAPEASDRVEIVLADKARYELSADGNFYTITLYDGESYEGVPGQGAWRSMRFREQSVRLPTPESTLLPGQERVDILPVSTLMASANPLYRGEFHGRLSSVIITLVLGFIAVPMARLRPRQGRYTRVIWGVMLYAFYAGLLTAGRTMLEAGNTPLWLGLWWVHVVSIALGIAFLMLPRFSDWRARRRAQTVAMV
jgi:lipopolysaccharide export system permease protein